MVTSVVWPVAEIGTGSILTCDPDIDSANCFLSEMTADLDFVS